MSAQHLRVRTPQGDAGELSHEQNQYLFAEFVIEREAEVAQSIPHVVAAIAHCTNRLKDVFFD